jgi:hypothetical protein
VSKELATTRNASGEVELWGMSSRVDRYEKLAIERKASSEAEMYEAKKDGPRCDYSPLMILKTVDL